MTCARVLQVRQKGMIEIPVTELSTNCGSSVPRSQSSLFDRPAGPQHKSWFWCPLSKPENELMCYIFQFKYMLNPNHASLKMTKVFWTPKPWLALGHCSPVEKAWLTSPAQSSGQIATICPQLCTKDVNHAFSTGLWGPGKSHGFGVHFHWENLKKYITSTQMTRFLF